MASAGGFDPIANQIAIVWGMDRSRYLLPYYLAGVFDLVMCGVCIALAVHWAQHRKEEKRFNVIIVAATMAAALAGTLYVIHWLSTLFAMNFGEWKPFAQVRWVTRYAIVDIITTILVQIFYTERAYRLSKKKIWIPLILGALMLVSFGFSFSGIIYNNVKNPYWSPAVFADPVPKFTTYVWLISTLAIDIIITLTTTYYLFQHKSGWRHTDTTIKRLISLCLETQVPALCSAVMVLAMWGRYMFGMFFLVTQPKIYVIGLLLMLNFRFTNRADSSLHNRTMPNISVSRDYPLGDLQSPTTRKAIEDDGVHVQVETATRVDEGGPLSRGRWSTNRESRNYAKLNTPGHSDDGVSQLESPHEK